jgi:hypothetical protein
MNQLEHPLKSWIPYKLDLKSDDSLLCRWLNTFDKPYLDPFFDETISKCKALDQHILKFASVADLTVLNDWAKKVEYVEPTAFIFHISRCGSTLVSQLLGMNEQHISLAEVPFFDDILRLQLKKNNIQGLDTGNLLSAAIKLYGQKRIGTETNLFIKTDSWHVFYYKKIRQLYPEVPFMFLYRAPDEVFNSHLKKTGMQAVPGLIEPELFGLDGMEILHMPQREYIAKMIERYLEMYLEIMENDQLSVFLDYKEGIIPVMKKIAVFTKIEIDEEELLVMESRIQYHSKYPDVAFNEKKVVSTIPELERAFELYSKLEAKQFI